MPSLKNAAAIALGLALALPMAAAGQDAPGVFKVPGTESTIKFYGYVQLDTTLDLKGRVEGIEDADWATILPAVPADDSAAAKRKKPQLYMTARTSRFGIQTNTPSKYGNIGVKLEGDFNGGNIFQSETFTNSVLFRLRHAYGTVGGLLVGQTWSTFLDLGAAPDTVDFNGPGSLALVRNPMIRYTFTFMPGMTLALAAENTRGTQYGFDPRFQTLPDLHANFTYGGGWGHVSVRGVGQQYNRAQTNAGGTAYTDTSPRSAYSVAGAVSGSAKFGPVALVGQVASGPGIGRYLLNAIGAPFVTVDTVGDKLELWTVTAWHVGATFTATPQWRFNAVVSQTYVTDPKIQGVAATNGVEKDMTQVFANFFWSFSKTAELGVEYAWGQWKSFSTAASPELKGTQSRINASVHYNFF